jgi:hypothetical protein
MKCVLTVALLPIKPFGLGFQYRRNGFEIKVLDRLDEFIGHGNRYLQKRSRNTSTQQKKRPAAGGNKPYQLSWSYPISSQEHRADRTLTSVPIFRRSQRYFPSRISISGGQWAGKPFWLPYYH